MKAAKAWCVAGLMVLAGVVSCGKDEASGDQQTGGTGTIITGGNNGVSGSRTPVGGGVNGGTAGSSSPGMSATKLGSGCINDGQCADANAPGLKCVTAEDTLLGPGAPPKGVCTVE